jgi:phosphoketolase
MSHARSVQSSIDRSTAGFTRYLSDTTVVENATTGAHTTVNDSFADAVVKNDPQNFRVVPVSEYRQGTDF